MAIKNFVAAVLATTTMALLALAISAGSWTRDNATLPTWSEVNLWTNCQCQSISEQSNSCEDRRMYFNTVKAFSIIQLVLELVAGFALVAEAFLVRSNRRLLKIAFVCYALAIAANIVTWTTFTGLFRKDQFCDPDDQSYFEMGYALSWAFGVRLIELGALAVLLVITALGVFKGKGMPIILLPFATCVFVIGIITTNGRGWMQDNNSVPRFHTHELGLWDDCTCQQNFDIDCGRQRIRLKGAETFEVVAMVAQLLLIVAISAGTETYRSLTIQRVLCVVGFGSILVTTALFTEVATTRACGQDRLIHSQNLYWGYAVQCCALIVQALTYLYLIAIQDDAVDPDIEKSEPIKS